ncbi:beta-propeller domain-containing protein [Pseudalkalibacillus salsuginis]|uniref:beta-propeller domain-containing protein n=1 Tax=Pseudalkalibacillus salsuginis TaxID=2910972 RepID=UPI001F462365|nr:beta-propeller domain-containing protein [Pseudalkalibacillus salsuginis]MCF6411730.1 beta-propeller domain-containing protein [Pseudalkalibacillus salsuginis]
MKKVWFFCGVIVSVVIVCIYWFNQPTVLNGWMEDNEYPVVLQNKTWKLVFSTEIDPKTITKKNVYVTNSQGDRQDVTVSLGDDRQTIHIEPPKSGYELTSKHYILHINEDIRSTRGRKIQRIEPMKFYVERTLPVIGSKENLNDYFVQAIKDNKTKQKASLLSQGDSGGMENSTAASDSAGAESNGSSDFSETNVQVKGIDEPDIVKNDGTFLYQVLENRVVITQADPVEEMKKVSTITFPNQEFSPQELILHEDRLVVIGHSYEEMPGIQDREGSSSDTFLMPMHHTLKAKIYGIKDRSKPILEREVEIEGSYVSARQSNDFLYLVSSFHQNIWLLEEKKKEEIDLRPRVRDSSNQEGTQYIDYERINYFPQSKETNYTIISSIPIDKPKEEANFTTYLGSGNQIYMSHENLYIAVNTYPSMYVDSRTTYSPDTTIYKFSVDQNEVYFNHSAEIEGTVLNQFSMDEYEGNFRIATTKGDPWDDRNPSSNHLFILNDKLKKIGEIKGLAKGERIYSARFMKERIYMVTFKQVDPLFVIDASDPSNPEVKGELKIPGFSNYLHPYDDNHIIGFGQNTKLVENGSLRNEPMVQIDGIKISLFDVSDMNKPVEKFTEIVGGNGTYSPLNHDHKALLFDKRRNLFAFPIHIFNYDEEKQTDENFFQGALIYKIDSEKGFRLATRISHFQSEGVRDHGDWKSEIQRLVYIDHTIYSLSRDRILAHDLNTFKQIGELDLDH